MKRRLRKIEKKLNEQQNNEEEFEKEEILIEVVPSRDDNLSEWPAGKEEVQESEGLTVRTQYVEEEEAEKYLRGINNAD